MAIIGTLTPVEAPAAISTAVQIALDSKVNNIEKGVANGVATLDANTEVVEAFAGAAAQVTAGNGDYVKKANGTWDVAGGARGAPGSGDDVFYENAQTVTASYTLSANKNAMSAGPITINTGVTVTVPTGARWVVV